MIYKFKNSLQTTHITIPFADLKEGTPISIAGAVANDSSAFGIVMNTGDKFVGNGGFFCDAEVIVAGYLDENECEKACGLTYTDEMKSALPLIVFVDEFLPQTPDELPEPTTEGDVLAVGKVADPSVVILPEQTVEIEEGETYYLPTGGDPTLFVDGEKVCVTVNNESVVGVVFDDEGLVVGLDHGCFFAYTEGDEWWFTDNDSYYGGDPITISVTGTKPAWVETTESQYSAWDAVFRITFTLDVPIGDIIYSKWSFEDLVAKMITNKMPCAFLVGFVDERNSNYYFMETKAKGYLYGDSAIIHFDCYGGDAYSSFSFDLNKYGVDNIQGN